MTLNHLKCIYWNIHGITSKMLGDKPKDPEFLKNNIRMGHYRLK